ncbi:MAG: GTPase [Pseudonocardiaceae bacterium]
MPAPPEDESNELRPEEFIRVIEKNRHLFPTQRKPNILICGQGGVGKTTTINTLFGEEVGRIGYFSRGTVKDELYEWESHGENIDVVDLPGLGDSKKRDQEYTEMYRRRIESADGFIVVVKPPRALNVSTIRTVNLLISCGVEPERIVFAYNLLTDIRVPFNGELRRIEINGIAGPDLPDDARVIEEARISFHQELCDEIKNGRYAERFSVKQIIPYDALSGWNLFAVFNTVLRTLPGDALMNWRNAVERGTIELQRRTEARVRKEQRELTEQIARLAEENAKLRNKQTKGDVEPEGWKIQVERQGRMHAEERVRQVEYENRLAELRHQEDKLKRQEESGRNLSEHLRDHQLSIENRMVEFVSKILKATVKAVSFVAKLVWGKLFG